MSAALYARIEWAGSALNEDCEHVARCCPDCEGVHPDDWDYLGGLLVGAARGHRSDCELAQRIVELCLESDAYRDGGRDCERFRDDLRPDVFSRWTARPSGGDCQSGAT